MLAHRLRYWSNIKTELPLVFVFSGTSPDIEDHEVIKIPEASNKRQPSDFTPANTSTIWVLQKTVGYTILRVDYIHFQTGI